MLHPRSGLLFTSHAHRAWTGPYVKFYMRAVSLTPDLPRIRRGPSRVEFANQAGGI